MQSEHLYVERSRSTAAESTSHTRNENPPLRAPIDARKHIRQHESHSKAAEMIPQYIRTKEDFHRIVGLPHGPGARESKVLEFKKSLERAPKPPDNMEVVRDITQFANSDGGVLLLGIAEGAPHGKLMRAEKIAGVKDPEADKKYIYSMLNAHCNDRTFASSIELLPIEVDAEGGTAIIIAINVKPCAHLVYLWTYNRSIECFVRTEEGKVAMRLEDIEARLMDTTRLKRLRAQQLIDHDSHSGWVLHGKEHDRQHHEQLDLKQALAVRSQPGHHAGLLSA